MWTIERTAEFQDWIDGLRDMQGRSKILVRIMRLEAGNPGKVEPVGTGVSEMKIDFGPGYRVYFMKKNNRIIILLAGGDKDSQSADMHAPSISHATYGHRTMANTITNPDAITKTAKWDTAQALRNEAEIVSFLNAALEDAQDSKDLSILFNAIGIAARARGMVDLAKTAGVGRESLYKALAPNGNPSASTLFKVMNGLGVRLHISG